MKRNNLIAFILFVLLSACGNTQKESSQDKEKAEKKEETSKKVDEKSSDKAEKVGMQALMDAYFKRTGENPTFTKKDLANGYAEFRTEDAAKGIFSTCQLAYYITKDSKEILAVTITPCMMGNCSSSLMFYTMMNNELSENQDMMEGLADMNALNEKLKEVFNTAEDTKRMQSGDMTPSNYLITLPQQGTTILCIKGFKDTKQKVAELQFNEQTGKFKFIKL